MANLSATYALAPTTSICSAVSAEQWEEDEPILLPSKVKSARRQTQQVQQQQQEGSNKAHSLPAKISAVASFAIILLVVVGHPRGTFRIGRSSDDGRGSGSTTSSSGTNPRRSFVCITGQVNRLELDNKIGAVLNPLRQAGYEPDIALVLDDSSSTPHVTNDQKVKVDYTHQPAFASFSEAADALRDMDFNVVTDSPYVQVAEPILNEQYVSQLQQKDGMTDEQHRDRSKNNIRMMESWGRCYDEMTADSQRSMEYDIVVRVREDAGFIEALDVDFLVEKLTENGPEQDDESSSTGKSSNRVVISNGCRQSHGMNDKFAVVSRDAAESYFHSPLRYYYTKPLDPKVISSESFIYYTYLAEGLTVLKPPEIRSVVKVITDENGNTLLFPGEKKTLIHMCRVSIHDESAPNGCTTAWDTTNRDLHQTSEICWPYKIKDPTCETCK